MQIVVKLLYEKKRNKTKTICTEFPIQLFYQFNIQISYFINGYTSVVFY